MLINSYKFTLLGCGSSPGVPRATGDWGACNPHNIKNKRMRPALAIERYGDNGQKTTIIIDTGPDFREQMLLGNINKIDAVCYTHAHADHTHGIDDLRGFSYDQKQQIPIYADKKTLNRLKRDFSYCFLRPKGSAYPAILEDYEIVPYQEFLLLGEGGPVTLLPLLQHHGDSLSLALRLDNVAYCTDVSLFPERTLELLKGVEILLIDCLQYKEHPSHLSLEKALFYIEKIGPKRAILTHMHIPFDYDQLRQELPAYVEPGYDGLSFSVAI